MSDYPRVVHVGFHPIGAPTNSGITLGTMFGDWPSRQLLQVCSRAHPEVATPDNALVAPLSTAPMDAIVRRLLGKRTPSGAIDGLNNSIARGSDVSFMTKLRIQASAANDIGPVRLPNEVAERIDAFRPQVLHSLLGGVRPMRLSLLIADRFDIPIVPHFMDDWPMHLFEQGQLAGQARRAVLRNFERVLDRAPLCLSIGTDMQHEYEKRYQRPCPAVGNSIDLAVYDRLRASRFSVSDAPTLAYVGGLHLGRVEVVQAVARGLTGRRRDGRPWRLELFVPPADAVKAQALEEELPVVSHGGSLLPDEVPERLVRATAVLFVESDVPSIRRFTRLSVSTKVPQYLASGRPILTVGPPDQGSVRALRRGARTSYLANPASDAATADALDRLEQLADFSDAGSADEWVHDEFGTAATRERLRRALVLASDPGTTP